LVQNFFKDEPIKILFTGHRGSGKTTALHRLISKMDTCRKHGISLYDYIKDILSGKKEMTGLSVLIAQKASENPT
jgi:Tfp pilus assembly pilus retraction ATPase PilT